MSKYRLFVYGKGPQKGLKEPGIYEDAKGRKHLRIREADRDSFISLKTSSITEAIKSRDARSRAETAAELGVAVKPSDAAKTAHVTVPNVVKRYQVDGYPTKKGVPRKPGKHRAAEEIYCQTLLAFFDADQSAVHLVQDDLDKYHTWRVETIETKEREQATARGEEYDPPEMGKGHRATDLELNTLNNAMRWAVRKRMLNSNPTAARARYYTASDAKHCREFSVQGVDELHEVAGVLMSSRRSEVLGWQLLIEGTSSLRSEEATLLQMNARSNEPGGLTEDGKNLCVRRAKKTTKVNPVVRVNEGLGQILAAHKIWHAQRYPMSPYYLPGRDRKAGKAVNKSALTKALDRLYQIYVEFRKSEPDPTKFPSQPYLTRKYTSHGAGRAFYVLARRCQGAGDPEIAYEINHTGGVGTLESVYALPAKHWQNGEAPGMSWLPTGPPAWSKIKKVNFSALDTPLAPDFQI